VEQAHFAYIPEFIGEPEGNRLLASLSDELDWKQQKIRLFGRSVLQPRLSCWYSDAGVHYAYSGLKLKPVAWHPDLLRLRNELQHSLGHPFNSVLGNAYRNGADSMGWHSDDERELGPEPVIASLSLGASRRFKFRNKIGRDCTELTLEHGSLLLMREPCQSGFQHAVPKTTKPVGLRVNLTFRQIMNLPGQ
jgi:alkylated DNA repair dioxygenase AlkB